MKAKDPEDPYKVLGLPAGADRREVKQAYRQKALETHPDLNAASNAAEQYARVKLAAEAILHGKDYASAQQRTSEGFKRWAPTVDRLSRSSRFPMYFCAACLAGGCVIFVGALRAHHAVFDGYSYYVVEESERRRNNPSPEQQRILSLLTEKKEHDSAQQR